MAKKEVWKLQRPLLGSSAEILAYTEDKKRMAFIPASEEELQEIFEDDLKIYVLGSVKHGKLIVDGVVEDQPW